MSVLLPENKPFSFLSLIMQRLYRFMTVYRLFRQGYPVNYRG